MYMCTRQQNAHITDKDLPVEDQALPMLQCTKPDAEACCLTRYCFQTAVPADMIHSSHIMQLSQLAEHFPGYRSMQGNMRPLQMLT